MVELDDPANTLAFLSTTFYGLQAGVSWVILDVLPVCLDATLKCGILADRCVNDTLIIVKNS